MAPKSYLDYNPNPLVESTRNDAGAKSQLFGDATSGRFTNPNQPSDAYAQPYTAQEKDYNKPQEIQKTTPTTTPVATTPEKEESFDWGGAVTKIGGQIGTTLANDAKVKTKLAWDNYNTTLAQAKTDGKFWFDPNTDLPSFEDYITNYPSQIQTLINGQQLSGDAADVGRWLDPALAIVGEVSGDRKKWDYVQNEALQGAEEGIGGGWQQMTINSILGAVQGFFGYEDAMAADDEQMRKLRKEYADKTKKWNIARKQQAKVRAYNARTADKTKRETAAATAKAEKEAAIVKRQQKMASSLKTLSTNRLRPQSAIAG